MVSTCIAKISITKKVNRVCLPISVHVCCLTVLYLPPGGGLLLDVRMTKPKPSLSLRWSVISMTSWSKTLGTWIRGVFGEPFISAGAMFRAPSSSVTSVKGTHNLHGCFLQFIYLWYSYLSAQPTSVHFKVVMTLFKMVTLQRSSMEGKRTGENQRRVRKKLVDD